MQQILMVTYQEMNKHDLKFTMDDIASQLGMSKKTLYKLFRSKNDLITAVIQALLQVALATEEKVMQANIPLAQKISNFLLSDMEDFPHPSSLMARDIHNHHPEAYRLLSDFSAKRTERLAKLLEQGIEEGIIASVPTGFIGELLGSTAETIIRNKMAEKHHLTLHESMKITIQLIMKGLLTLPEEQKLKNS